MMAVVPAWVLHDWINSDPLARPRREEEQRLAVEK
jgi:hypothetical protein